ncbi:pyruvate, phosphate dikinase/phosphoenolpyruvate synthase regulator [candidate division GN15 bacterium]|nr:pyruvate, phosphate dikinase/phosphoenolpyruvate synthase regulator [candidate division GN15 bacterium]
MWWGVSRIGAVAWRTGRYATHGIPSHNCPLDDIGQPPTTLATISTMPHIIPMDDTKNIVIISDGTGRTAKRLMDAVLVQYQRKHVDFNLVDIYTEVRDRATVDRILDEIQNDYLVIFSIISQRCSQYLQAQLRERSILHLNVLEPMITTMSKFLGVHPDFEPGILQIIDDRYYSKIDAISYTVEHDDGRGMSVADADVVLLGLSRTCKTPISMYLSCNHGLRVANIPIVPDVTLEHNLLRTVADVDKQRVFGLTMKPEVLARVREERSKHIARAGFYEDLESYFDLRRVREEVRFCRYLFGKAGWRTIDVTHRAIEEVSREVIEEIGLAAAE